MTVRIIATTPTSDKKMETWKQELLHSYSSVSELLRDQLISEDDASKLQSLGQKFKVRLTPYYASLMKNDPHCPIRRQALPELEEENPELPNWAKQLSQEIYGRAAPWHSDAIGDLERLAAPRLTHRYQNRAILHLSSLCAVYCRFCFRKSHLNQTERTLYEGSLEPALTYLQNKPEIRELILTGGDPLSSTDTMMGKVLEQISQISHIRIVRIHSRMAVTLPQRFTSELLDVLSQNRNFQIVLVSHFNHPQELSSEARKSILTIKKRGIIHLNQSVLLRGVNATAECLANLFQDLYELGVIPFYLHHPDWTPGTFHFRVSIEHGKEMMTKVRGLVPGPAIPHYVLDIPQGHGKTPILDPGFKKIEEFQSASPIQGAIYEISAPHTRLKKQIQHRYLDLFHT